jgi:hypothetical protein
MRALPTDLRRELEAAVLAGRRAAEAGVRAALSFLGVEEASKPAHLDEGRARLRRGLRAKQRQLGGEFDVLVWDAAYEQWHRLLFARFLAGNGLLRHPQFGVPVTLAECEELAEELDEPDGWSVAARFAAEILPGIFRLDDPCVQLRLAPEHRVALEKIVAGLPAEVFAADDSLGWVYQYWQSERKNQVNASEVKIGGADLGPVTQLFTENYMVRFLLENSLGAWWAARHPDSPLVKEFEYLRFDDDGQPAAGRFEGWPETAAEVAVMDPCCGSGHFLVEAFGMLWRMRAEEEGRNPVAAQDAVLRDNLFGLELDRRCVQIAMFAVALTAWKQGRGWRQLPTPNIACSGIPAKAPLEEWTALADGDARLEQALERLHSLFKDADTLGSLIDPRRTADMANAASPQKTMWDVDFEEVAPLLAKAAARETDDPATAVLGADAAGSARAAALLSCTYTLIATNVPYLTSKAMAAALSGHLKDFYAEGRADLATAFILRANSLASQGGTYSLVTTQNWLSLTSYTKLRRLLLETDDWLVVARLGSGAFAAISGEVVQPVLSIHSRYALRSNGIALVDVSDQFGPAAKGQALVSEKLVRSSQAEQLDHPDHRIVMGPWEPIPLLSAYADAFAGIQTGDYPRFGRFFWELKILGHAWEYQQSTVSESANYGGREHVLLWERGEGALLRYVQERLGVGREGAWIRGKEAWGARGVAVRLMGALPASLYGGALFDNNVAVIRPHDERDLAAVWAFCCSDDFSHAVRQLDRKMNVTNATLVKVPFDLERWRTVAEQRFPDGLLTPQSDDPTQWLFEGYPVGSTEPLQVGVARLVGYRWLEQPEPDDLDGHTDEDGIVCLPAVGGELPAADRLTGLLATAFGEAWSPAVARKLLEQAGSKKKTLADWLRDDFFKHHCKVFQQRPFVWHIWDGTTGGFSVLVNYHRLDRAGLERLTYTYLGDWIERQRADAAEEVVGADVRLAAARELKGKLEAILEGEPPYDIYVRWKEHEQPIGWDPDLDDGVRLNIRPFVEAGVLRSKVNVHWKKDRGKNPDGSERHNDRHYTNDQKRQAREQARGA